MQIADRKKKYGSKNRIESDKRINIVFDIVTLNIFVRYILSDNRNIRRSNLINMRNLFNILDLSKYTDGESKEKVRSIIKGLEARLDYNIQDPLMIFKHINGGLLDNSVINFDTIKPLSNDEVKWVDATVAQTITTAFIDNDVDSMIDACSKFKNADYVYRGDIMKEIEHVVTGMQTKFRKNRVQHDHEQIFSLKDGVFEERIKDIHDNLCMPSNKLITGIQGINELTAGGFESGRTYILFGLPGEGKSLTLLDLAYQIKRNNKTFRPKDPTKIPAVLFLTMENSVKESVERLFNMAASRDSIINYDVDTVIDLLRTNGELYLTDESPIDIIIKFVPGESVDTSYLYTLIEDLEDEGYEVITLIQDYIKRIKSVSGSNGDIRLELGAIVNEFKTLAVIKDIPVISASQLNRNAASHIDEARKHNKNDLVRLLGRDNIGESMLILENADGAFMIAPEYDSDGAKYLGIQLIKKRFNNTSCREYMYLPYVNGNSIKLVEDISCVYPTYRTTLKNDQDMLINKMNNGGDIKKSPIINSYMLNDIKQVEPGITINSSTIPLRANNIVGDVFSNVKVEEDIDILLTNNIDLPNPWI